jgi:hypothetical protein
MTKFNINIKYKGFNIYVENKGRYDKFAYSPKYRIFADNENNKLIPDFMFQKETSLDMMGKNIHYVQRVIRNEIAVASRIKENN